MSGSSTTTERRSRDTSGARLGLIGRALLFVRQVLDEMRKVVRPTREELRNYTAVVVGFIVVVMAFIVGLDQLSMKAMAWIFGSGGSH